jgi:hypothetical protein
VRGIESYLHLAGIGIDGINLVLGEHGWSECGGKRENCEGSHCFSPKVP